MKAAASDHGPSSAPDAPRSAAETRRHLYQQNNLADLHGRSVTLTPRYDVPVGARGASYPDRSGQAERRPAAGRFIESLGLRPLDTGDVARLRIIRQRAG